MKSILHACEKPFRAAPAEAAAAPAKPVPVPDVSIAHFKRCITPKIGCLLAGYGFNNVSEAKLDDLYMTGLAVDDGEHRVLLVSFDLIGLDDVDIRRMRTECARLLGTDANSVMFSCTHTHGGPMSRSPAEKHEYLNQEFMDMLEAALYEEVGKLKEFTPCQLFFYSCKCNENKNRRYTGSDNTASFLPHRREVRPIADEYTDREFGMLLFRNFKTGRPAYVVGNYAAHALSGITPGLGTRRITADYPGAFRDYVTAETLADSMFVTGASGDMVPLEDELGSDAVRRTGVALGKIAIGGIIDSTRNSGRFRMRGAKVGGASKTVEFPLRRKFYPNFPGKTSVKLEIQCLAFGDVCFVGVPGELCAELGQEIKWHSPFRRTFIAYNSTGYISYLCPGNFMVSGGYESNHQRITTRSTLKIVETAVDTMYELRSRLYPQPEGEEAYPDCLDLPNVNIPRNV